MIAKEAPMSPLAAPLEALEVMARDTFTEQARPHWSTASAILGRIEDEALYSTDFFGKYATAEAYAKDMFDLTKGEVRLVLKLWRLIKRCEPMIGFDRWAEVKRARALLLFEVLEVGADVTEWFMRMQACDSTAEFEQEVRKRLGEEVWVQFRVRVPLELLGVIEEALERALEANPELVKQDADEEPLLAAEAAQDKRFRFQALEAVCLHYLQTVEAPQLELPTEASDGPR